MAKNKGDDGDVLPPEVRAEVEKVKSEEGGNESTNEETESVALGPPPEDKESRRARKDRERREEREETNRRLEAAESRAAESARIAEELRASMARQEQMLQERNQPKERREEDPRDVYEKQMKKAKDALAAGNLDEYHERLRRALKAEAVSEAQERIKPLIPQQTQQGMPQRPVWATAVENQFPDVVMDPRGLNAVAAFASIDPTPLTADKLMRAFTRARQELKTGGQEQKPTQDRERQRQMLSSGPTNGGSGRGGAGRAETTVDGLPKNYRDIARQSGMTAEQYVKNFATMNPEKIRRAE